MRTKNGSVRELIAGIRQAAEQEEYNPAEDLKTLQTQYKRLGKKDFGLMLDAMVENTLPGNMQPSMLRWSRKPAAAILKQSKCTARCSRAAAAMRW